MTSDDFTGHGPAPSFDSFSREGAAPSGYEAHRPRLGEPRHDRSGERRGPTRGPRTAAERQIALVDARFWTWLHDEDDGADADPMAAQDELQHLTQLQGARLVRTLWFSDRDLDAAVAGLQQRRVPSNAQDRGVTMLRAMAQDLLALAEHGTVDRVLLVSDDDRLLLAVDEAQRRGLQVDMLVDRDSQDLKALRDEDPNWASLLQAADGLVVLGGGDAPMRSPRTRAPAVADARPRREAPSAEASGIIEDEILTWWDDETPDQRDHWRQEMQGARGIPQELDRQLLLRISRRLGHALSPGEKSMMRQQVRQQMAGGDAGGAASAMTPTGA